MFSLRLETTKISNKLSTERERDDSKILMIENNHKDNLWDCLDSLIDRNIDTNRNRYVYRMVDRKII